MRQIKTWICENCGKTFEKVNTGHTYRFCKRSCAALYNKPSQALVIADDQPMSKRTEYRRRSAKGETLPVFRYPFNEHFIDTWSDELAWLVGLVWTDGCLYGNSIEICSEDPDLMEIVEAIIEQPGGVRPKNKGNAWRVVFTSKVVTDWFMSLGLTPKKSLTIEWPKIPTEWEASFMRGVIDGDGWVTYRIDRDGQQVPDLVVGACTASPAFYASLCNWFDKLNVPYTKGQNGSVLNLNIRQQESLRRLYPILYPAGEWTVTLHRKHLNWVTWLDTPRAQAGRPKGK